MAPHLTGCVINMKVMSKKRSRERLSRSQALAHIPMKNPEILENRLESGEVVLTYPMRVRPWMTAMMRRLGGKGNGVSEKKLQLDELGTMVWALVDGNHSVKEIINRFSETYRVNDREAEVAVTQFLRTLGKRGLIGLK